MTGIKPTAKQIRLTAIKAMHAAICPEPEHKIVMTRKEIVSAIRMLGSHTNSFSRAQRWYDAVDSYAALVEDETNPLDWAYFQGSVWFGYAIDGLI
jgi:hypothetical protein